MCANLQPEGLPRNVTPAEAVLSFRKRGAKNNALSLSLFSFQHTSYEQ